MPDSFPDAETLALCERYSLRLRRSGALDLRGRPRLLSRAEGLDFEGFAEYLPGMDLRHLDWRLYARGRGLYLRRYTDEAAGLLLILLDASGSMALGAKWTLARRLAAVLLFTALQELHRVLLAVVKEGRLSLLSPQGGSDFIHEALRFLGQIEPGGPTRLAPALEALPLRGARGEAIVISDFLEPEPGVLEAVLRLGLRCDLLRISAPGEFELPKEGALHDPEGPEHCPVSDPWLRETIQRSVKEYRRVLPRLAANRQALFLELSSEERAAVALERYFKAVQAKRGA